MSNNPSASKEWKELQTHCNSLRGVHMRDLFAKDAKRFEKFHIKSDGLLLDYSRHRITEETVGLLLNLARAAGVEVMRDKMFGGDTINVSEKRAALHASLRGSIGKNVTIDGENVNEFSQKSLKQIQDISERIRKDKKITDVVNIGIGGSDSGARIVHETLQGFHSGPRIHFVSNIDGARIAGVLKALKPESTIFIVVSKTFSTMETLTNAETAKGWAKSTQNFYAVTMNVDAATKFGIAQDHFLPMRAWIGGRMSLWSAAGLPVAIAAGFENFKKLLDGAQAMDKHFQTAPLEKNIPVLMGLLGVWYRNFWNFGTSAVLPYAHNLRKFPAYVQQLDMESNGKSVNREGDAIDYETCPVIFGETGTNAQHAFMQLMHQGTDIIPADFIIVKHANHDLDEHHRKLNANALAQAQALMHGTTTAKNAYQTFDGNRPSSTVILEKLDPWHLGLLLALYEHRMFVQGILWNINSFDQWGVELGKTLANDLLASEASSADQTTRALLRVLEQ